MCVPSSMCSAHRSCKIKEQRQELGICECTLQAVGVLQANQRLILTQTEDIYPIAAFWEQLANIANAKHGNMTNNKWYEQFNTKVEVDKSVGESFNFEKIWEYYAQEGHNKTYTNYSQTNRKPSRQVLESDFNPTLQSKKETLITI